MLKETRIFVKYVFPTKEKFYEIVKMMSSLDGILCRHIIALVSKDRQLGFATLKFEERWRIDFFQETNDEKDALILEELPSENNPEEEKVDETAVKN